MRSSPCGTVIMSVTAEADHISNFFYSQHTETSVTGPNHTRSSRYTERSGYQNRHTKLVARTPSESKRFKKRAANVLNAPPCSPCPTISLSQDKKRRAKTLLPKNMEPYSKARPLL